MLDNIYIELTRKFNSGKIRAIISSGQAVVLYKVSVMSKDGDWILREEKEALSHILSVLSDYGAVYRFGAPLDIRWMRFGWSSHFEFMHENVRIRTDFCTRPPRISATDLESIWVNQKESDIPLIGLRPLIELKKTNRERDYAVIGELSRLISDEREQLLVSRSARDILRIAEQFPDAFQNAQTIRPCLVAANQGREALEIELDAERRHLMKANEERLQNYMQAASIWRKEWRTVKKEVDGCPLAKAHQHICKKAEDLLPMNISELL